MTPVPDLVKLSKLETTFLSADQTQHITYVSGSSTERRKYRQEERWKRKKRLGRGAFGSVYLEGCVDGPKGGELRAVKRIPKHESGNYYRELEAIALFSHSKYEQCFVKSYGWYENEEDIFLAMEYFVHGDLQTYLGSPLQESECQLVVFQILEGLQFMHDHDFTHRDLKPNNILVACKGPDWWVKIADFGISKRATEGLTALRTMTGTPAFMAPEVIPWFREGEASNLPYTIAVDVWSLGVMTFFMLTGQNLFEDSSRLSKYVKGEIGLRDKVLHSLSIDENARDFLRSTMVVEPTGRLDVRRCQQHMWLGQIIETSLSTKLVSNSLESQQPIVPKTVDYSTIFREPQPSAAWTTPNQTMQGDSGMHLSASLHFQPSAEGSSQHTTFLRAGLPASSRPPQQARETAIPKVAQFSPNLPESPPSALESTQKPISVNGQQKLPPMPEAAQSIAVIWHKRHQIRVRVPFNKWRTPDVLDIAYSPDGSQIASALENGDVDLYNADDGSSRKKFAISDQAIRAVAYSPDGRQIASGSFDHKIKIWDSNIGTRLRTLKGHLGSVLCIAYSPNGRQIASGSFDKTIKVWDIIKGQLQRTLEGQPDAVRSLASSPDGTQLVFSSPDSKIKIWDCNTWNLLRTLNGHFRVWCVAYSPNGKQIASGSWDKTIKLWDPGTGNLQKTLEGHSLAVMAVAYSPDGRQLASGSSDGTVRIWNTDPDETQSREPQQILECSHGVSSVTFAPDGKQLAAGLKEGMIMVWSTSPGNDLEKGKNPETAAVKSANSAEGERQRGEAIQGNVRTENPTNDDRAAREGGLNRTSRKEKKINFLQKIFF